MAIGMQEAGFSHEALVEWWAPAARVLRHNGEAHAHLWAPDRVIEADVRSTMSQLAGIDSIDLVAGGPPCQPFSLAGAGAGHSDQRNMFPAALDVVRRVMPRFVVFENVPGLLRPSFLPYVEYVRAQLRRADIRPKPDELWNEHFDRIASSRGANTYEVYEEQIDAADLGVPQNRRRVFIIAIRSDLEGAGSWGGVPRTHSRASLLHDQWVSGVYWLRHGIEAPVMPDRLVAAVKRSIDEARTPGSMPWRTLRDLLQEVPEPTSEAPEDWPDHRAIPGARTYPGHNGSPMDSPSKTIKAGVHGVAGGEAMLRELDGSVRYLTVREAALVQGFPREYEFPGPRSRVMGVIGNAVAVRVASAIGATLGV
jgi:DNA (cytosine-5)-methyltransferase 1